ncbi:MAG: YbhB/YbcL family Raf kinase inhibitor-like protein, partial [Patescibacteria group bacterium]
GLPADLSAKGLPAAEAGAKAGGVEGMTSFGRIGYGGPCPPASPVGGPSGKPHRYFFKLFALSSRLDLLPGAPKAELEKLIAEHLIEKAELVGHYSR